MTAVYHRYIEALDQIKSAKALVGDVMGKLHKTTEANLPICNFMATGSAVQAGQCTAAYNLLEYIEADLQRVVNGLKQQGFDT